MVAAGAGRARAARRSPRERTAARPVAACSAGPPGLIQLESRAAAPCEKVCISPTQATQRRTAPRLRRSASAASLFFIPILPGATGGGTVACWNQLDVPRPPLLIGVMDTRRHMARTPTATGLYWNERGHVGCAGHIPYEGSDTWVWERWEPLPPEAAELSGRPLRCETCGKGARR